MVADAWSFDRLAEVWAAWMLRMSWQVAVLVAAVWVLTLLLRRSNATLRYALWLLVFAKLLLPPGLGAPWSVGTVARDTWPSAIQWGAETTLGPETAALKGQARSSRESNGVAAVETGTLGSYQEAPGEGPSKAKSSAPSLSRGKAIHLLIAIWGAVALGLLTLMTAQWHRHSRRLLSNAEPAPEEVMAWGRAQAARMGLRQPVDIRLSSRLRVPCVVGFRKAVVLLPLDVTERLSPGQQADVIAHEMAHIKRYDLQTGWLASILVCLYWFHPAVWLANLYLRREREMACDDKVLYTTRREGTEYAATMVRVAERFDGGLPMGAGFLGLFEVADNLLQRIRSVADGTRSRRAGWRSVTTVAFVALALVPMAAWTPSTWAQQPAPTAQTAQPNDAASPVDREIEQYYAKADPDIKKYIRWTAEFFGPRGDWLPQDAFASLSPQERAAKVEQVRRSIEGEESYKALVEAGALGDPSLVPALIKVALAMREGGQDNRARWMAVAALGRIGDKKAVPALIPLIDHYNQNTRLWAQASLVRLTGENFGTDKQAWAKWANAAGPETAISQADLEHNSRQSEEKMKPILAARQGGQNPPQTDSNLQAAEKEIAEHYASAAAEVKEYIKWTARQFGRAQMWLPKGAFDSLTPEQREEKVKQLAATFEGEYGRHQCNALAEAGVIKDKRLLPGLMKMAGYHRDDRDYDCRAKWIATASLGRQDDPSAVPLLVDLVDHGNQNTKMWAQASMARLTGQNFGTDKKAWAEWWNANGKEPKIDVAQLKPWKPFEEKPAVSPEQQTLLNEAEDLFKAGKYDEARTRYEEVHAKYPKWDYAESALMMVGMCLERQGKKDEAIKAYERAIQEYPNLAGFSETTYYYVAQLYKDAGRKEDAVKALQKCVELCKQSRGLNGFPGADALKELSK